MLVKAYLIYKQLFYSKTKVRIINFKTFRFKHSNFGLGTIYYDAEERLLEHNGGHEFTLKSFSYLD